MNVQKKEEMRKLWIMHNYEEGMTKAALVEATGLSRHHITKVQDELNLKLSRKEHPNSRNSDLSIVMVNLYNKGLMLREIAEITGYNEQYVKNRIYRSTLKKVERNQKKNV